MRRYYAKLTSITGGVRHVIFDSLKERNRIVDLEFTPDGSIIEAMSAKEASKFASKAKNFNLEFHHMAVYPYAPNVKTLVVKFGKREVRDFYVSLGCNGSGARLEAIDAKLAKKYCEVELSSVFDPDLVLRQISQK